MTTRALIVHDSRTARVQMRRLLEGAEAGRFEVEEVVDGGAALELLAKTRSTGGIQSGTKLAVASWCWREAKRPDLDGANSTADQMVAGGDQALDHGGGVIVRRAFNRLQKGIANHQRRGEDASQILEAAGDVDRIADDGEGHAVLPAKIA